MLDTIVRICADSPLVDFRIIDDFICDFKKNKNKIDYLTNSIKQSYPLGMNVEVFSLESLIISEKKSKSKFEKEHVTPYIKDSKNNFRIKSKDYVENLFHIRLTVDEECDFDLIKNIIENLYPKNNDFSLEEILFYLNKNKNLLNLNEGIKQKHLEHYL